MKRNTCFAVFCQFFTLVLAFTATSNAMAGTLDCPEPKQSLGQYGPFDYTSPASRSPINGGEPPLSLVERVHFTINVATLKSGHSSGDVQGDLDYTLRAFPNHHRALQTLVELALQTNKIYNLGMSYSVPCFFIRAGQLAPSDGMVDAIYAQYLARTGQKDLAIPIIKQAVEKMPKKQDAKLAYTIGLAYFYMDDYKSARDYAKLSKELGSAAVGLDKLLATKPNPTAQHK